MGRRCVKVMKVLCWVALVPCLVIAVYVFQSVPLSAEMPYSGRFRGRSRDGIPMPVAMALPMFLLYVLWQTGRGARAHFMGPGSRKAFYVLGVLWVLWCIYSQWIFTEAILVEEGVIGGRW